MQVLSHGPVPEPAVQKAFLKLFHFPDCFFRRIRPDHIQQFVDIHIRQRCRDRAKLSSSDPCPPGKISPELIQVQIVISGKIPLNFTVPRRIVLIILHELPLSDEVHALVLERAVPVLIELHHLEDAGRDRTGFIIPEDMRLRSDPPLLFLLLTKAALIIIAAHSFKRKQCVSENFSAGTRTLLFFLLLQHDCITARSADPYCLIEQFEHDLRFRPVIEDDSGPLFSPHPECVSHVRLFDFCQDLPSALDITSAELVSRLIVPLAHHKSDPLPCLRIGQNRETAEIIPLLLLADMIFFFGVGRKL